MDKQSKQNTLSVLQQIQNLTAEEQALLINQLRRLEVNAQDEQYFTNVTKAMQAAGYNPFKRGVAGIKAWARNKSEATKGINSRKTARMMRFIGMNKTADFMDRWLTKAPAKKLKKIKGEKDLAELEEKMTSKTETGELVGVQKQLTDIMGVVVDIQEDVSDIKSLIMPKGVMAKDLAGTQQAVQFNPFAPQGEQFKKVTQTGKIMGIGPSKAHQKDAARQAAKVTAELALKIIEKDRQRAELKKKYEYKDKEEKEKQEDSLAELRVHVDERFDMLEKKLGDKNGILGMLGAALAGLWLKFRKFVSPLFNIVSKVADAIKGVASWAFNFGKFVIGTMWKTITTVWNTVKAIGSGLARLLGKWFPGLSIPGLVAGSAAVATTGAIAATIDKGMKQTADKAIDAVLSDVTKNQEREGFKPEDSYAAYKMAMDKSLSSSENASQERQDYIKQQWTSSEGLSDLERRMAARYFYEKEGSKAKGPTSRGGARGQTIPAEVIAEGSDTVDTNYANVPVAAPVTPPPPVSKPAVGGTGALAKKTIITGEEDIKNQIKKHEGLRLEPYKDSVGKWTIGYGHLIGDGTTLPKEWNRKITQEEADVLFEKDYAEHRKAAAAIPGFEKLNTKGKRSLIDLTYNMGPNWVKVKGFKRFEAAMSQPTPDVEAAAQSLEDSLWYKQVKGRAKTVVNDLRAGLDTRGVSPSVVPSTGTMVAQGGEVKPATTIPAARMDGETRALQASNSPASVTVVGAPTVVNNTQVSQTVGKRPAAKADVLTQDKSLTRVINRDSAHPVLG